MEPSQAKKQTTIHPSAHQTNTPRGEFGYLTNRGLQFLFKEFMQEKFIDAVIPIAPDWDQLRERRKNCKHPMNDAVYFEFNGESKHGWCCGHCGEVIQWG